MKDFSVITPVLNAPNIFFTQNSVISQVNVSLEHIILDGLSDIPVKPLRGVSKQKGVNALIYREKDNGIYDAMNKGITKSDGMYLNFLNSGDYYINNYVLKNVKKLISDLNYPDIVYGNALFINDSHEVIKSKYYPQFLRPSFFINNFLCHQSIFVKRDFIIKHNLFYNLQYNIHSDLDWLLRIFIKNNPQAAHYSSPVCFYDTSGISSVRGDWNQIELIRNQYFGRFTISIHRSIFSVSKLLKNLFFYPIMNRLP